jgi:hypothetical protein
VKPKPQAEACGYTMCPHDVRRDIGRAMGVAGDRRNALGEGDA